MRTSTTLALLSLLAPAVAHAGLPFVGLELNLTLSRELRPGVGLGAEFGTAAGPAIGSGPAGDLFVELLLSTAYGPGVALGARGGYAATESLGYCTYAARHTVMAEVAGQLDRTGLGFRPGVYVTQRALAFGGSTVLQADGWQQASVSGGIRGQAVLCVIPGRPLRDARDRMVLPIASVVGDAEAQRWLQRGRGEHASVPAFLRLAAELRAMGAPGELVARAQQAADDERRHAALCYGLAARAARRPVRVRPMAPPVARRLAGRAGLVTLAVESLREGIVGEGQAAAEAAADADRAVDPVIAAVERSIAVEESRHATLAGDIVAWASREGGRIVREAVRREERA